MKAYEQMTAMIEKCNTSLLLIRALAAEVRGTNPGAFALAMADKVARGEQLTEAETAGLERVGGR